MSSAKIIYVTGCLGFIGSHVTRTLLSRGDFVIGVDKITPVSSSYLLEEFLLNPNFKFIHSDINDLADLLDCDYIINTAAETHVGNSIVCAKDFLSSNVNGVFHLLNLLKNFKREDSKPIFIHFSTDEVYGDIAIGSHDESSLLKPSNPYSSTKASADMLVQAWSRTYGLKYVIVRPTNNYGPNQYPEKLIPKTCKYLRLGRKIPLHQGGSPVRCWLHAQDTADAVVAIMERGNVNQVFNISGNYEDTNLNVVKKVINLYHQTSDYEQYIDFSFNRPGQDVRYSIDDTKLRSIGWKNQKVFDAELPKIISFYKERFIW